MRLTSKKSFKVVKYLLQCPEVSQLELSRKTSVALGYVNEIGNFLYDLDIVSKGSRRLVLENPVRLLEMIGFERPFNRLVSASFRLATTSVKEGEEILRNGCVNHGVDHALTVFSGLRRFYEYHISFPAIHAYVSRIEIEDFIEHGEGPIALSLLAPDNLDILSGSREIEGFSVCDKPQIIIDLFTSGVGKDAAIKFLEVVRHGKGGDPI